MTKTKRKTRGFTLLESLMAMVILAAAAAGILLPFTAVASAQQEAARQVIAARLASDLTEQIQNTDYADVFSTWDGYTESTGQVKNALGIVFSDPAYHRFGRSVTCGDATVAGVDLLWVTVTVTFDGREITNLKTLIGP